MYVCVCTPLIPHSPSSRPSQSTQLSSLCYTPGSLYCLLYTWQCVYQCYSPNLSHPPFTLFVHMAEHLLKHKYKLNFHIKTRRVK